MCHKHSYTTNDPKPRRPRPCASPFPYTAHPPRQYSPSHHALDFSNSAHTRPHIALHLQHTMYQNAQCPSATTTPSSTPACRTSKFRIFSADSHTRQSRAFMIRFVECIFPAHSSLCHEHKQEAKVQRQESKSLTNLIMKARD